MTTSTIGTSSRNYSTISAWEADSPTDLTSSTDTWEGECYNDSEFSEAVVFSGVVADATYYTRLSAATGHSFQDHASKDTDPQLYSTTYGVALSNNGTPITLTNSDFTVVERIQVKNVYSGGYTGQAAISCDGSSTGGVLRYLRGYAAASGSGGASAFIGNYYQIHDCFAHLDNSGGTGFGFYGFITPDYDHLTAVNIGSGTTTGFTVGYGAGSSANNCLSFGFGTDWAGTWSSGDYNASDSTNSPGANAVDSISDPFEDGPSGTNTDFRVAASSAVDAAGVASAFTTDIVGHTRADPPDIGCWEIQAGGGGGGSILPFLMHYGVG